MSESETMAESFTLTKENVAAMLALLGKAENTPGMSPTGLIMMDNLKQNLSILFDRLERTKSEFAMVRIGNKITLDDTYWEYAKIPKDGKTTKALALVNFLSSLQQASSKQPMKLIFSDETTTDFEFVVKMGYSS